MLAGGVESAGTLTRSQGSCIALAVTAPGRIQLPGLVVEAVDVSGMGRFGLEVDGRWLKSGVRDVRVTDSDFRRIRLAGLSVHGRYLPSDPRYTHTDVAIDGVRAWDNAGDPRLVNEHSGSGIVLSNVRRRVIRWCVAWNNGAASRGRLGGPYGIWTWDADSVLIARSLSFANRTASKADGGGFIFDDGTPRLRMSDNVSFENDGAGVLIAQFAYAVPFYDNLIERHVSIDDGPKNGFGAFTAWGAVTDTELQNGVLSVRSTTAAKPSGVQVYTNWWKHWWEEGSSRNIRVANSPVILGSSVEPLNAEPGAVGLDVGGALRIQLRDDERLRAAAPR